LNEKKKSQKVVIFGGKEELKKVDELFFWQPEAYFMGCQRGGQCPLILVMYL
jgi:hypothetical protein